MLVHALTNSQYGNTIDFVPDLSHVMFVGTYRPNEVSESHPLHQAISEIKKKNIAGVVELQLQALSLEDVERFVAETFQGELEVSNPCALIKANSAGNIIINNYNENNIKHDNADGSLGGLSMPLNDSSSYNSNENYGSVNAVVALASMLFAKTMGNPYFVNQMTHSMYQDGYIRYVDPTQMNAMSYGGQDYERGDLGVDESDESVEDNEHVSTMGVWECDLEKISNANYASNVVDLLVNKLQSMDKQAQILIGVASITGSLFELNLVTAGCSFVVKETNGWEKQAALQLEKDNFIIRVIGHETQEGGRSSVLLLPFLNNILNIVYYKFSHDRVHHAASLLLTPEQKEMAHSCLAEVSIASFFSCTNLI